MFAQCRMSSPTEAKNETYFFLSFILLPLITPLASYLVASVKCEN